MLPLTMADLSASVLCQQAFLLTVIKSKWFDRLLLTKRDVSQRELCNLQTVGVICRQIGELYISQK